MNLTKAAATISAIGVIGGGLLWAQSYFTPMERHEALASEVSKNTLRHQWQSCRSEYFWLRSEARKYPDDPEIQEKLKDVKRECEVLRKRMHQL